jgi:hypothetical protein
VLTHLVHTFCGKLALTRHSVPRFTKDQAGRQFRRCSDHIQQAKRNLEGARKKETAKQDEQEKVEEQRREFEVSLKVGQCSPNYQYLTTFTPQFRHGSH